MNYSHPQVRRTARRIPVLCAVYFVVFAFTFLFRLERDLLAQLQFQLSDGTTIYHPLFAAFFCTLLLTALGCFVGVLLRWLPLRMKAAVWFLPFLLLGALTHWRFPQLGDMGSSPSWWLYLLLLVLYGAGLSLGLIFVDSSKERETFSTYVWPNALQLILFSLMTAALGNTDISLHHTLRSAALVGDQRYAEALDNARWERQPSRLLSAMTALSLGETGQLGERLFAYPQPYGSEGLLPAEGDTLLFVDVVRASGCQLGYKRSDRTPATLFLQVADTLPGARPAVRDFLLSAHLLDRHIEAFAQRLLLDDTLSLALPLHFREALVLRQHLHHVDSTMALRDDSLDLLYQTFDSLRHAAGTKEEREFWCRNRFGATYWCYYFFR